MANENENVVWPLWMTNNELIYGGSPWGKLNIDTRLLHLKLEEDAMTFAESWILKSYMRAWRMWNTWLVATERQEIDLNQFIEDGFSLIDDRGERYITGETSHGCVVGRDGNYEVEISPSRIHISFKGKPRYTWYPCVPQMGNLKHADEDQGCRVCERSWLESQSSDRSI